MTTTNPPPEVSQVLTIKRVDEVADRTRTYKVVLDGAKVGGVRSGETRDFEVSPGAHTLQLKVDWCTSKPLSFEITGEGAAFECGSNAGSSARLAAFLKSKDYIWLRQVG